MTWFKVFRLYKIWRIVKYHFHEAIESDSDRPKAKLGISTSHAAAADEIKQTDCALTKLDKDQSNKGNLAQYNRVKVASLLHKYTQVKVKCMLY